MAGTPSRGEPSGLKTGRQKGDAMSIILKSDAFSDGQPIPRQYTGDGANVSPPLSWSNLPANTRELALIVDDPDAPRPQPWVHWVVYKIPVQATGLSEHIPTEARLKHPAGALQGKNTSDKLGYSGPEPPPGHGIHHYYFRLYALDAPLEVQSGLDKTALLKAMAGHVIGEGELMGTYQR